MPDWEKIYNFIARREENNDNADILSEMRRLPPEDLEAFRLALDLFDLMKEYNITQEEARNVYEFKEDLKINDWQEAWRLYNEGGVIRREQNIPENSCFETYLTQLREQDWDEENLENMRRQTVNLINQMNRFSTEHPELLCTALVVGHVQSGKTANYCADINFWTDLYRSGQLPGYDTFIILTSNNTALGTQTEERLRKDIIPVRDWCNSQQDKVLKKLGGLLPFRKDDPLYKEKPEICGNIVLYTPEDKNSKCVVAVVIKNRATVERLNGILNVLRDRPKGVLVIDDEADVITPTLIKTGDAAATRKKILEITTPRTEYPIAYIAFTATPYATVLNQHPSTDKNPLYPHIAQVLTPSKEYFGSDRILGAYNEDPSGQVITITDFQDDFPVSMKNAFAWFICTAAARRIKNQNGQKHQATTMLIHLSKKVADHKAVQRQLEEYLRNNSTDIIERCYEHWCSANGVRQRYTKDNLPMDYPGREHAEEFEISWNDLQREIKTLINAESITNNVNDFKKGINFRIVNATARTAKFDFHYPTEEEADFDTAFVAIGGDRIARGLTLAGLTTTYFGRETQFGDTLLQYARWHGYRKGYEVLPRIWMTQDSIKAFKDAAAMEKTSREKWNMEFEQQLDHWQHPLTVACPINSRIKPSGKMAEAIGSMKQANRFQFETNTFPANTAVWRDVREKTEVFLRELDRDTPSAILRNNRLWKDVSSEAIIDYLEKIAKQYPDSATFCSWLQSDKLRMLQSNTRWNVCFIPLFERVEEKPVFQAPESYFNNQYLRTVKLRNKTVDYFYVKTIRSAISDDVADADTQEIPRDNEAVDSILNSTGNFETPLLRIYLHAPVSKDGEPWLENMSPEEISSNPVILLSIRRKLPENIMLSLQVNPADFGIPEDDEEIKQRIANTTFELVDKNDNNRGVYCKFTPSENRTRTPQIATLLADSMISGAEADKIKREAREITGSWKIENGRLTEDVTIRGLLAYNLAKILLGDDRNYNKYDCDLWVDCEDNNISLDNYLSEGE